MILIQLLLLLAVAFIIIKALRGRTSHSGKAWKKIGLMLLIVLMVIAVISPESTNKLAHMVGVGRGADLLLYMLVVAFIYYALNNYLKYQDQRDALYRLARKTAILEATQKNKEKENR